MGAETRRKDRSEALFLLLGAVLGRLTLAVLASLCAMFLFVKLAHEMAEGETRLFDVAVLDFFHAHRNPWLFQAMVWVSWLGGPQAQPIFYCLGVLGLILARRFFPDGLSLLVAGLGGAAVVSGLKRLFHRPRPDVLFDSLGYSFPSGHSFFALVLYCLLAYWLARDASPRRRLWIWGLAIGATLLMGFSRIYLGEHFPSDVAAAYAIAIPWVWGCLALPTALHRNGRDLTAEDLKTRYQAAMAQLREAARFLPNLVKLVHRLARDSRVPRSRKIVLTLLTLYLALPFDLVPDFIPVLGVLDDIILVGAALFWVLKAVPPEAVREHWDGDTDLGGLLEKVHNALKAVWKGKRPAQPRSGNR